MIQAYAQEASPVQLPPAAEAKKPFNKIFLVTELNLRNLAWVDLAQESEKSFTAALNASWLEWFKANLPKTVQEVVICDLACIDFYRRWTDSHLEDFVIPPEYQQTLFLKTDFFLSRTSVIESMKESTFSWEGRTVLQDVHNKRLVGSLGMASESRTFRHLDQKGINSGLASGLYRSALPSLMNYRSKLETLQGTNRVAKLVISGHKNLSDLLSFQELLKTKGNSLGIEVKIDSLSLNEAKIICFYQGEEKTFNDLLSSIKELKSSHSYALVSEITAARYIVKFVAQ